MTYLDKIIIGDNGEQEYKVFIMIGNGEDPGGYNEISISSRYKLISYLSQLLQGYQLSHGKLLSENRKFELSQIQNGPSKEDLKPGFYYLECFPAIDEFEFKSILEELIIAKDINN